MSADDLTRLRWAMEPALDESGTRLAYVVSGPDAATDRLDHRVVLVDAADGGPAISVGLPTSRPTRSPRWSPAGDRLAVRALVDDVWQVATVGGAGAVNVGPALPGEVRTLCWSPDGSRLACEVAGADGAEIWIVDMESGAVAPLGLDENGLSGPEWAPDGTRIAGIAGRSVWLVDPTGRVEPREVAASATPVRAVAWSPNSQLLAYLGTESDQRPWANVELLVVSRDGGGRARLAPDLDRSIGQVVRGDDERGIAPPRLAWTPDGMAVLSAYADGGTSAVAAFGLDGGVATVVTTHAAVLEFAAGRDGSIAYTWSDSVTPGEVSVLGADGVDRRRSELAAVLGQPASTRRIPYTADDGVTIDGWLTMPTGDVGEASVPLVVQVHGGPHYPIGERYSFDAQRLAASGYAVLRANPRGSQGYGAAFASGIAGDWGGRDASDIVGLVAAVLADASIDPARVAVIGESYGGYLALWLVATTDRFAGAVAENGISDLAAGLADNPAFWAPELRASDEGAADRIASRSPIARAAAIDAPVLLIYSSDDAVCPPQQTIAMHDALAARAGTAVELIAVPGEGHMTNVVGRPSRRIGKLRAVDEFLARHLAPDRVADDRTATGATPR